MGGVVHAGATVGRCPVSRWRRAAIEQVRFSSCVQVLLCAAWSWRLRALAGVGMCACMRVCLLIAATPGFCCLQCERRPRKDHGEATSYGRSGPALVDCPRCRLSQAQEGGFVAPASQDGGASVFAAYEDCKTGWQERDARELLLR